jgi:hypothetical protein
LPAKFVFAEKLFQYLRKIVYQGDFKLMSESVVELFDVLFCSEIKAGQNVDQARKRVGTIFKLNEAKVDRLFSAQAPISNAIQIFVTDAGPSGRSGKTSQHNCRSCGELCYPHR